MHLPIQNLSISTTQQKTQPSPINLKAVPLAPHDVFSKETFKFYAPREKAFPVSQLQPLFGGLPARRKEVIHSAIEDDLQDVFYPTPPGVVERMVRIADIKPGSEVLEPSAGTGSIADVLHKKGAKVHAIERMPLLAEVLRKEKPYSDHVKQEDFLKHNQTYERIVMNPPYGWQLEIKHTLHAYDLLKPGGKLVALLPTVLFQDHPPDDAKGRKEWETYYSEPGRYRTLQFREWLDCQGSKAETFDVKGNPFSDSDCERQTNVDTRILTIRK
jgi:hypothetical protein